MESALALYLKDISNFPLLTAEEEIELGRRIREDGDAAAREKLINCNLRLVISISKPYKNAYNNMSLEDIIAYGNTGLLTAVDKYDYRLGYRFSTCAVPWIKQAITKAIAEKSRTIRIPAHIIQSFNKLKKVEEDLTTKLNREPTSAEIAQEMGITEENLSDIYRWKQNSISLSSPLGDDGEDTLEDISADEGDESPVEYTEKSLEQDRIAALINKLDNRTATIIKLRFGLGQPGDPEEYYIEHTLEEIGDLLTPKITRERVRQILMNQLTKWKMEYKDGLPF